MKILLEDSQLYKGVFWIVDIDDLNQNKNYCFGIPSDSEGHTIDTADLDLNAKSGTTYNHERTWDYLDSKYTHNKPYNYYPRGRVEIHRGQATIYMNPNICTEEVLQFIKNQFNLTKQNLIKTIRVIPDGSNHYKCYLDK